MEDFLLVSKLVLDQVLKGRSEQAQHGISMSATNIIVSIHLKAILILRHLRSFPGIELVSRLRQDSCCCQEFINC